MLFLNLLVMDGDDTGKDLDSGPPSLLLFLLPEPPPVLSRVMRDFFDTGIESFLGIRGAILFLCFVFVGLAAVAVAAWQRRWQRACDRQWVRDWYAAARLPE